MAKDYLNINETARETGLSIPTIRTKLERGLFPGASQVQEGKRKTWRIPFSDLLAAGLIDKVTAGEEQSEAGEIARLELELRLTKELLARADQELEAYRQRERQLFNALETRETQEARRSLWERIRGH